MIAVLLAAALLPLFLLYRYLHYSSKVSKLRKGYDLSAWWLSKEEKESFKAKCIEEKKRFTINLQEHKALIAQLEHEHKRAREADLPTTNFGTYSRHSNLGKEIQGKIDELEGYLEELDLGEREITCRQPRKCWDKLNELLKKLNIVQGAIFGWLCGAFFFFSAYLQGESLGIWISLLAPAVYAGVGAGMVTLFARNPAAYYMQKPVAITIDNVDVPMIDIPKKNKNILKFAGMFVWLTAMGFACYKGSQYGKDDAIARKQIGKDQNGMSTENPRQISETVEHTPSDPALAVSNEHQTTRREKNTSGIGLSPANANVLPISYSTVLKLNSAQVENIILAIYAHYGSVFESPSAQQWADRQPWYRKIPGRTIKEAEKEFDLIAQNNVKLLVARWNQIQVEDGHLPVPVEESPLAGRSISEDLESGVLENTVLKALPVDETSAKTQGNLNATEIAQWDLARVRYEINTIYARHGVVFPKREIQAYFETKEWYRPALDLTFTEAESRFSPAEKIDIEILSSRRKDLTDNQ